MAKFRHVFVRSLDVLELLNSLRLGHVEGRVVVHRLTLLLANVKIFNWICVPSVANLFIFLSIQSSLGIGS